MLHQKSLRALFHAPYKILLVWPLSLYPIQQDVGDYEAAFSDEEEGAQGGEQCSVELGSAYNVTDSSAEETFKTTEIVEDFNNASNDKKTREHSSESTSGDSGSESSRPLSPGPVSTQYYYFYQGTLNSLLVK